MPGTATEPVSPDETDALDPQMPGDEDNSACGNANIDGAEECDDGNDVNADGCNRDCRASGRFVWELEIPADVEVERAPSERFSTIEYLGDSGALVVGARPTRDGDLESWGAAIGQDGEVEWETTLTTESGEELYIEALAAHGDNRAAFTGYTRGEDGGPMGLLGVLNTEAAELSVEIIDDAQGFEGGPSSVAFRDVAVDGDGNLIAVGGIYQQNDLLMDGTFVRKYSPQGELLWSRADVYAPGQDELGDLQADIYLADTTDSNDIYVLGHTEREFTTFIVRLDPDGNAEWTAEQEVTRGGMVLPTESMATIGGEQLLIMMQTSATTRILRRYTEAGDTAWTREYEAQALERGEPSTNQVFSTLTADDDGNIIVAGYQREYFGTELTPEDLNPGNLTEEDFALDILITKLDGTGEELWTLLRRHPAGHFAAVLQPDQAAATAVSIGADSEIWAGGLTLNAPQVDEDRWVAKITP